MLLQSVVVLYARDNHYNDINSPAYFSFKLEKLEVCLEVYLDEDEKKKWVADHIRYGYRIDFSKANKSTQSRSLVHKIRKQNIKFHELLF